MKTNILSEKDLDSLLNQAFLNLNFDEPKNQNIMETISHHKLSGTNGAISTFNSSFLFRSLLTVAGFGLIATILYYSSGQPTPQSNGQLNNLVETNQKADSPTVKQDDKVYNLKNAGVPKNNPDVKPRPMEQQIETIPYFPIHERQYENYTINKQTKEEVIYAFPNLTEKEIKANNEEKEKMAKLAAKLNKTKYALISSTLSFYLQTAEVSNLEYRTFLFDLLINGKKDEFIKAKPEQDLWLNACGTHMFDKYKESYFSSEKFNRHPVVNISLEGAEMYCKWLNDLANEKTKQKIELRLPKESEWVFAAKDGNNSAYPWGTDSIQNDKNKFMANFGYQQERKKHNMSGKYPHPTCFDAYTSAGMMLGNDSIATADVYSYNHTKTGIFCLSGNASEMVYIDGSKNVKTKGGNWASRSEYLKINSEDEFKGDVKPSPMIGFRVVITYIK